MCRKTARNLKWGAAVVTTALACPVFAEPSVNVSGYVREHLSFNLGNPAETAGDDRYDMSMARTTLRLDVDGKAGPIGFNVIGRASKEYITDYLKRLENAPAGDGDLASHYDEAEIREATIDFDLGDRVFMRLGKQQVVWGESDFFAGTDIIHGFDYSWRSFLEVENEELRKPLIMANARIEVPEADGSLQLLVRPGWDRNEDIGNTYDLFGGRWANQPNKGVDFIDAYGVKYNYDHKSGSADDANWGFRWTGLAGPVNYSFSYWKGINPDPIVNVSGNPYKGDITAGASAEFIYPHVDTLGFTVSGYSAAADAVFSAEAAYTKDKPFNINSAFAGFGGVIEKDTLRMMVRMDKTVDLSSMIGTSRPSFFSVQLFDTWIPDFKASDDIVDLAGYSALKKEHSTIATVILAMNYDNDRVNPTIAAGYDLSYGGGFLIPSVEFAYGNNWRVRAEADIFFNKGKTAPGGAGSSGTHLFGYFANNNQLALRVTYQF